MSKRSRGDTIAQHVASAFDKPTVVIANGRPYIWHSMHECHKVVMNQLPRRHICSTVRRFL